uniref:DNA polymerase n=1 Tax=Thelephora ganbajun TaxID=370292 RepID=A0A343B739_THEGA|nr:DNA polymerase [Thelephora ganbajun]
MEKLYYLKEFYRVHLLEAFGVNKFLSKYFVTFDIETIKINNKLIPYCISIFNGNKSLSAFINKNMDQKKLFKEFIHNLLSLFEHEKGDLSMIVYAHNLSGFDGVFLMNHLLTFGKVKPLIHNGKLISIKLIVEIKGHKNKRIIFKDSFLMLPLSLRELCNSFNVENPKGVFPFLLNDLTYKGQFPEYKFFSSISLTEYLNLKNQYSKKIWSFKNEAIKYCELDCVSLHQIISKFSILIYNTFKVDAIKKALTLPSLAMRIWKTFFMPKDTVFSISGQPEYNIRQSFTGGAVDVYIPHNSGNETLYSYDVNALYPYVMLKNPMPTGKPIAFDGNIRKINQQAFGFFYCKITSPEYLEHPLLQRHIKTVNGLRTIAGLGSWTGWIFSEEMDNAVKYGYKFEIIKGYQFKKGYIFSDYVNKLYNLRLQYEKGDSMNLIAKLLLNSLYGKFGMKPETIKVEILKNNSEELNKYLEKFNTTIVDIVYLENYTVLIYNNNKILPTEEKVPNLDTDSIHQMDVNVAIASAITAYGRIHMSYFKNNPLFKLFYSDTDSIVIDAPLPEHLVGNELGQLKLEHVIKKAVFLAPKVYGFIDENGTEIIKIKGINHEVASQLHINELENLLIKDSCREFTQTKWFKKVIEGEITVTDIAYTLKVTSNKRQSIYVDDIFNGTEPYNYNDIIKK